MVSSVRLVLNVFAYVSGDMRPDLYWPLGCLLNCRVNETAQEVCEDLSIAGARPNSTREVQLDERHLEGLWL